MLVAIDKRGSINLPATIRRELGLEIGAYLDMTVAAGGTVVLQPVEIVRSVRLTEQGLGKLAEARQSGRTSLPGWLGEEMKDAEADSEPEIS